MKINMRRWAAAAGCALLFVSAASAGAYPTVTPAQVADWQERGEIFILVDVRPDAVYALKHARAAIGMPAFSLSTRPLPRGARVVVYDGGAGDTAAAEAARALQAKGHPEFYVMEGGLTAWEAAELPIVVEPGQAKTPLVDTIGSEALARIIEMAERVLVLDLRPADTFRYSRIPGAQSASSGEHLDRALSAARPEDLIVLVDDGEGTSRTRAEELRRRGFRAVKWLHGGMPAWRNANLRVER